MRTVSPLTPLAAQTGVRRDGDGSAIRARRPADRSRPATLLRSRGQRPAEVVAHPERALAAPPPARTGAVECIVPKKGLLLPRQLPFQAWLSIGSQLSAVANSSAWCLGDWLAYGETAYNGRYRDAIERTSLDYQTLRNYAWVARSFELSRRRDTLSFGHHAEVAALPEVEQDFWLRKAEELDWSRNQLRREVRASLKERGDQGGGQPANGPAPGQSGTAAGPVAVTGSNGHGPVNGSAEGAGAELTIMVTPAQLMSCEEAANRAGLSVCAWAALALADAARNALTNGAGHIFEDGPGHTDTQVRKNGTAYALADAARHARVAAPGETSSG